MSTLGVIPFKFNECGRKISAEMSQARFTFWKIQLLVSTVYSLHINMTLILSLVVGSEYEGHQSLGIHITRGLLSAAFNVWAYELFLANLEGTVLLYNFTQTSNGEGIWSFYVGVHVAE